MDQFHSSDLNVDLGYLIIDERENAETPRAPEISEKQVVLQIEGAHGEEIAECSLVKSSAFEYGNGMCAIIDSPTMREMNWGRPLVVDVRYIDLDIHPLEQICIDKLAELGFTCKKVLSAQGAGNQEHTCDATSFDHAKAARRIGEKPAGAARAMKQ